MFISEHSANATLPLLLLEHLDAPDLYLAVEEILSRKQELFGPSHHSELVHLLGSWWFDAKQNGFLLDYQCAQLLGFTDHYRRYSVEEVGAILIPEHAQKLFFNFLSPDSGDVFLEHVFFTQGKYRYEPLVVQASVLQRDSVTGQALQVTGTVCYEQAASASYFTRELTGDGLFYLNNSGDLIITSSSYHNMLGYINGDFPSSFTEFVKNLIHPDDLDNMEVHNLVISCPDYGNTWSNCLRLKHKSGRYIWTISRGLVLKRNEKGVATVVVGSLSDIDLVHQNFDDMNQLLFSDNLTGLFNRTFLEQNMVIFDESNVQPVSVLFLDVTGLKLTNDILGHGYGDFLLLKLCELLYGELLFFMYDLRQRSAELNATATTSAADTARAADASNAAATANAAEEGDTAAMTLALTPEAKAEEYNHTLAPELVKQGQQLLKYSLTPNFEMLSKQVLSGLRDKINTLLAVNDIVPIHDYNTFAAGDPLAKVTTMAVKPQHTVSDCEPCRKEGEEDFVPRKPERSLAELLREMPEDLQQRVNALLGQNVALLEDPDFAQKYPLIWAMVETVLYGHNHPSLDNADKVNEFIRHASAMSDEGNADVTTSTDKLEIPTAFESEMVAAASANTKQQMTYVFRQSVPVLLRLAGDEFMVILPHCPQGLAQELARRIRASCNVMNERNKQLPLEQRPVPLCFGIGSATIGEKADPNIVADPNAKDSLQLAIERADWRMQSDKEELHPEHLAMLKDYFEAKLQRDVSMRDDRRQVLLNRQERELLRNGQLDQNLTAKMNQVDAED